MAILHSAFTPPSPVRENGWHKLHIKGWDSGQILQILEGWVQWWHLRENPSSHSSSPVPCRYQFSRAGGRWNDSFPARGSQWALQFSAQPAVHVWPAPDKLTSAQSLDSPDTDHLQHHLCKSRRSECSLPGCAAWRAVRGSTAAAHPTRYLLQSPAQCRKHPGPTPAHLNLQVIWSLFQKEMAAVLFLHSSWKLQFYAQQMCRREDNFPWQQGQKNCRNSLLLSSSALTLSSLQKREASTVGSSLTGPCLAGQQQLLLLLVPNWGSQWWCTFYKSNIRDRETDVR